MTTVHHLLLQAIESIEDEAAAAQLGLLAKKLVLCVHSGSRGFGESVLKQHVGDHGPNTGMWVPCTVPIQGRQSETTVDDARLQLPTCTVHVSCYVLLYMTCFFIVNLYFSRKVSVRFADPGLLVAEIAGTFVHYFCSFL